jgi:hypothetical protein
MEYKNIYAPPHIVAEINDLLTTEKVSDQMFYELFGWVASMFEIDADDDIDALKGCKQIEAVLLRQVLWIFATAKCLVDIDKPATQMANLFLVAKYSNRLIEMLKCYDVEPQLHFKRGDGTTEDVDLF